MVVRGGDPCLGDRLITRLVSDKKVLLRRGEVCPGEERCAREVGEVRVSGDRDGYCIFSPGELTNARLYYQDLNAAFVSGFLFSATC